MTYKELLEYCKSRPGCLAGKEQRESESVLKYKFWLRQQSNKKDKK